GAEDVEERARNGAGPTDGGAGFEAEDDREKPFAAGEFVINHKSRQVEDEAVGDVGEACGHHAKDRFGREQTEPLKNPVATVAVNAAGAERGPQIGDASAHDSGDGAGMNEEHVRGREEGIEETALAGETDPLLAGTEEAEIVFGQSRRNS